MKLLFAMVGVLPLLAACSTVLPSDDRLHYIGRHHIQSDNARFDWVGSGVSFKIGSGNATGNISVVMNGGRNQFSVFRNGQLVNHFRASGSRATYYLTAASSGDQVSMIKATEVASPLLGGPRSVTLYSIMTNGVELGAFGTPPSRRIAVYGDSDSASFGVDGKAGSWGCTVNWWGLENFSHGWISAVSKALDAEVRVVAESGVGVVKNAAHLGVIAGAATLSTKTLPELLHRTLETVNADDYNDLEWRPSVILIFVGANDYINLFPPSADTFKTTYTKMVRDILRPFAGNEPPVLHICGGEAKPCDYIKEVAAATNSAYADTGDVSETMLGCAGHRNFAQQAAVAKRLIPVVAKTAGWEAPTDAGITLLI